MTIGRVLETEEPSSAGTSALAVSVAAVSPTNHEKVGAVISGWDSATQTRLALLAELPLVGVTRGVDMENTVRAEDVGLNSVSLFLQVKVPALFAASTVISYSAFVFPSTYVVDVAARSWVPSWNPRTSLLGEVTWQVRVTLTPAP